MADEQFDPSEHKAGDVVAHIADAPPEEVSAIVAAERADKNRVTVLKAAGEEVDVNARYDASGRRLFDWEVAPKPQASEEPASE